MPTTAPAARPATGARRRTVHVHIPAARRDTRNSMKPPMSGRVTGMCAHTRASSRAANNSARSRDASARRISTNRPARRTSAGGGHDMGRHTVSSGRASTMGVKSVTATVCRATRRVPP